MNDVDPKWREAYGPGLARMPVDPVPHAGVDWNLALATGQRQDREDSMDRLNEDGTWGTGDAQAPGGTGIVFGHSHDNLDSCVVATKAMARTEPKPNAEHRVREWRHSMEWWEMTRDPEARRRFNEVAQRDMQSGYQLRPYRARAGVAPGSGLPWNGRIFGWKSYMQAERHRMGVDTSAWMRGFVATCDAAATSTGQLIADPNLGGWGLDQLYVVYAFHQGILTHGYLTCCAQLQAAPGPWVEAWLGRVAELPRVDYYGYDSIPAFLSTEDGELRPCTGTGQHGDPGFGYFSPCCVLMAGLQPERRGYWLDLAAKLGPTTADTEDERKYSMLLRGATA